MGVEGASVQLQQPVDDQGIVLQVAIEAGPAVLPGEGALEEGRADVDVAAAASFQDSQQSAGVVEVAVAQDNPVNPAEVYAQGICVVAG